MKYLALFCVNAAFAYQAILTDIEGTTTSIAFVRDVLFPYAKEHVSDYVEMNQSDPALCRIIEEVKEMALPPDATLSEVVGTLRLWMDEDRKITPLKSLQGMMWKDGYERGQFLGHVYQDASDQLAQWKKEGLSLYVYSSGSVPAQKLLFAHSNCGDLTPLFSGYFDTKVGGKKEVLSYLAIANELGLDPKDVLFLSDTLEELNAARATGMGTVLLCREGAPPADSHHAAVQNFHQIHLQKERYND